MRMLSPADIAERTGLSRAAIYRAIEDGDLLASKLRGRIRVEEAELAAWAERSRVKPRTRLSAYEPPIPDRPSPRASSFHREVKALQRTRVA